MKTRQSISIFSGIIIAAMLLTFSLEASALEIAWVDVPKSVTIENKALVLNGAGIRKKFFFKIYVGALYLPVKHTTVNSILNDVGGKRIVMSFLYKEVTAEDLVNGWNDGFTGNNSAKELKALQERINQFNSLFTTVHTGDEIRLDYLPGKGTQVSLNGTLKGSVPGEDFSKALLKIWLGSKPADKGLKKAWLGK
jgi:hypothetical protein